MITAVIAAALVAIVTAYLVGRHHGATHATDHLWGTAMALGGLGAVVRSQAAEQGTTVAELLKTCVPTRLGPGTTDRYCARHLDPWPCPHADQ